MDFNNLINYTDECIDKFKSIDSEPLSFLENIRSNLIEKLRSENSNFVNELKNFTKEIKEKNQKISFNNKDYNLNTNFLIIKNETPVEKFHSNSLTLEIAICGSKHYRIFDKIKKNRYIKYKAMPFYGVIFSENTCISSKTASKTFLLVIKINS